MLKAHKSDVLKSV